MAPHTSRMATIAQIDTVREALYLEIDRYRKETFNHYTMIYIGLEPSNNARKLSWGDGRRYGYTSYDLQPFGIAAGHDRNVLHISFQRFDDVRPSSGTIERLRRMLDQQFRGLFQSISFPTEARQSHATSCQQKWWAMNGKHFALLELPRELRDLIYDMTIMHEPTVTTALRGVEMGHLSKTPNRSLFRVSKQVGAEFREQFWLSIRLSLLTWPVARRLGAASGSIKHVRHLGLELDRRNFRDYFGTARAWTYDYGPEEEVASVLRDLQLVSLTITLPVCPHLSWRIPLGPIGPDQHDIIQDLLDTLWPQVRGHSNVVIDNPGANNEDIQAFNQACRRASIAYQCWRRSASMHGQTAVGLRQYDQWLNEVDNDSQGGACFADAMLSGAPCLDTWRTDCMQ